MSGSGLNPNERDSFAALSSTIKSSAAGLGMRYQPNTQASGTYLRLSLGETSEEFRELISDCFLASTNQLLVNITNCLWMQIEENMKRLKVTGENWLQITNPILSFHHHTHSLSVSQEEKSTVFDFRPTFYSSHSSRARCSESWRRKKGTVLLILQS